MVKTLKIQQEFQYNVIGLPKEESKKLFHEFCEKLRTRHKEGYWYSEHNSKYPKPVANELSEEEAQAIYDCIVERENGDDIIKVTFMGRSACRFTGEVLGCNEYQTSEWIWPADFAPHYVLKYRVKPSDAFLKYIGYL